MASRNFLASLLLMAALFPLTATVELRQGVPMLMVDGKPERARIFWGHGASGGGGQEIGKEWLLSRFEAKLPEDDNACTLQLRFGEEAGTVWIDEIAIRDLEMASNLIQTDFETGEWTNRWTFWCQDRRAMADAFRVEAGAGVGGSAGLRVDVRRVDGAKGFHLYTQPIALKKGRTYAVSLRIRANEKRFYKPELRHAGGDFRFYAGLPPLFAAQVALAAAADIRILSFPVRLCWNEPGKEDFTEAIRACENVLAMNPKALLLPRIDMKAPAWWLASHPEAAMQYEDGRRNNQATPASDAFRKECSSALTRLVAALEKRFPASVLGYHPSGQNTGEWFYMDSWGKDLCGYDGATAAAWKAISDKAVPTPAERRAAFGQLRHPKDQADILAFEAWRQEAMAGMLVDFADAIRAAAPKKLTVFFYGYEYEFGSAQNGPANTGHYALRRLLSAPSVDVLCAPISYFHRGLGGATTVMSPAESVALAGKLWLNEDDTRTHLTRETSFPGWRDGGTNAWETRQLLRRNVFWEGCRNQATWWMDLGGSGWFNDAALWEEMKALAPVDRYFMEHPAPYRPEIASIIHERSMLQIGAAGAATTTTRPLVREMRSNLNLLGADYGQYQLEDAAAGKVGAKLCVFAAAWAPSDAERKKLAAAMEGRGALWCWLPGYVDGPRLSTESVKELTGFSAAELPEGASARAVPTDAGKALGLDAPFGPEAAVKPLLTPREEKGDEVLARFATGEPAVILRPRGKGFTAFCATTEVPRALLALCADRAGVKRFTKSPVAVSARGPFLGVHASVAGDVPLSVAGRLSDALTGTAVGRGPMVHVKMAFGETRIFRIEP
ncbi:MAG: hypothetical protein J0L75_10790 [Spirochaetes bacterium]|nr:hypothetical protein [Spirochaetota bacterium]